jgi:hypothetical protein
MFAALKNFLAECNLNVMQEKVYQARLRFLESNARVIGMTGLR